MNNNNYIALDFDINTFLKNFELLENKKIIPQTFLVIIKTTQENIDSAKRAFISLQRTFQDSKQNPSLKDSMIPALPVVFSLIDSLFIMIAIPDEIYKLFGIPDNDIKVLKDTYKLRRQTVLNLCENVVFSLYPDMEIK